MDFYTVVLRQSASYWVALCLENGLVGQGNTQDDAIAKLKEAIESFQDVRESEENICNTSVSIKELHEYLTIQTPEPILEVFELRAVYA
jgi:predicted RNase H-like HicB family nuclease